MTHPFFSSDLWALGCIIYQLASGRPPFKGKTQYQTFQLVGKGQFTYPPHFPVKAKELINQLLVLDVEKRLGYGTTSYVDLKAHSFFSNINWETLSTVTPPVLKPPAIKPVFPNEDEQKRQNTILVKAKSAIPFNIEDLPDGFLLKVCQYLDFFDLLRVSRVCKRLHNVTLEHQLWDRWLAYYQRPLGMLFFPLFSSFPLFLFSLLILIRIHSLSTILQRRMLPRAICQSLWSLNWRI
jgi:serine/threonine protein kinase